MLLQKLHKHFFKTSRRRKLMNAFHVAGLYESVKYGSGIVKVMPFIMDIQGDDKKEVYVFRLPHGVNPRECRMKRYVFQSIFGENMEMNGTHVVKLTVYKGVQSIEYDYDFNEWAQVMKSCHLPVIAGKDRNGKMYVYDMTENPHLLMAGETGSGKSVMLRSIITSWIQYNREGLQLYLADLKRSEFHLFRNIDIVKSVMTQKNDVIQCINYFHKQLSIRGDLLDNYECSHVDELPKDEKVDYLLLCIDEFSLLRNEKDALDQLSDLTALGRALGVYVVLSTQRPDKNIVEGLLKANLTVRYAFRHADKTNSNITLGDGSIADASLIKESEKGKFFMRYNGFHVLQSPYLTVDRAKEILSTYKTNKPAHVFEEDQEQDYVPLQLGGD